MCPNDQSSFILNLLFHCFRLWRWPGCWRQRDFCDCCAWHGAWTSTLSTVRRCCCCSWRPSRSSRTGSPASSTPLRTSSVPVWRRRSAGWTSWAALSTVPICPTTRPVDRTFVQNTSPRCTSHSPHWLASALGTFRQTRMLRKYLPFLQCCSGVSMQKTTARLHTWVCQNKPEKQRREQRRQWRNCKSSFAWGAKHWNQNCVFLFLWIQQHQKDLIPLTMIKSLFPCACLMPVSRESQTPKLVHKEAQFLTYSPEKSLSLRHQWKVSGTQPEISLPQGIWATDMSNHFPWIKKKNKNKRKNHSQNRKFEDTVAANPASGEKQSFDFFLPFSCL